MPRKNGYSEVPVYGVVGQRGKKYGESNSWVNKTSSFNDWSVISLDSTGLTMPEEILCNLESGPGK